jgi:hypothetical protein
VNRRLVIIGSIALSLGVIACVVDPFLLGIVVIGASVWIGGPLLAVGIIMLLIAARRQQSLAPAMRLLAGVVLAVCFGGTAMLVNHFVQKGAVLDAKAYPQKIAPLLETYRRAHGTYPATLDQLPSKPSVPRLLRSPYGYRSDGQSYSFSFPEPGGLIDTWQYDSETRQWHLST